MPRQERRYFSLRVDQLLRRCQLSLELGHPVPQPGVLGPHGIGLRARPLAFHGLQRTLVALVTPRRDQRRVQALAAHDLTPGCPGLRRVELGQDLQLVRRRVRLAARTNLRVRARRHDLNSSNGHCSFSVLALLTELTLQDGNQHYVREGNLRGGFCLPPDDGAIVKQALEASRDILFNEHTPTDEAQITWADALVRLADIALGTDATDRPTRDRYQALIHLRTEDLNDLPATELAYLHLGPAITPRVAKYMTCDATVRLILEQAGAPINEGHKYRTVPDKLRRIIEERDRGCRIPGCTGCRWIAVHHITHWRDHGPTETWNLVALCKKHHRMLHKGHLTITGNADDPNGLTFTDKHGKQLPTGPKPKPPPNPPPQGDWRHPTGEHLDFQWITLNPTRA